MSDAARKRLALRADRAMGLGAVWVGAGAEGVGHEGGANRIAADERTLCAAGGAAAQVQAAQVQVATKGAASLAAPRVSASLFASGVDTEVNAESSAATAEAAEAAGAALPPALPREGRQKLLQAMDRDQVSVCTKCALCQSRMHTVFGEGDCEAPLLFIGEGPGENEDKTGRPFVGRAGQLLDKMIAAMGLRREQVYITNIVKCRPPGNRVPAPEEVAACTPYLVRQMEIIQPQVIVTLGLPATRYLLQVARTMGQMRGNWHAWNGIPVMPTYHPSYILRSYNEQTRAAVWSDLRQVMTRLGLERKS